MEKFKPNYAPETKEKSELNKEKIRSHIESGGFKWVEMKELLRDTGESCVDGRRREDAIGMPGGNGGEFILALAAVEAVSGEKLDIEDMDSILNRYLEESGKFYIHTDSHALEKLGINATTLKNPPEKDRQTLLEKLTDPQNMGCGHLRLMLENSERYGVRRELAEAAIKSIFKAYWSGKDVEIEVLEGRHKEEAVVNIMVEGEVNEKTEIPAISPHVSGQEMFVNHPQAAQFMREEVGKNISEIVDLNISSEQYREKIAELAQRQLSATVENLASGLPVYNVIFNSKDKRIVSVEEIT